MHCCLESSIHMCVYLRWKYTVLLIFTFQVMKLCDYVWSNISCDGNCRDQFLPLIGKNPSQFILSQELKY